MSSGAAVIKLGGSFMDEVSAVNTSGFLDVFSGSTLQTANVQIGVSNSANNDQNGRIRVDGSQEGDWVIDTGSGSVRVTLPADAAFPGPAIVLRTSQK